MSNRRRRVGPTGLGQTLNPPMTVTKRNSSPGRARRKPLKPLRRECRVNPAVSVVTMLVCFFYFAREAAGAVGTRRSLRPLFFWAHLHAQLGRIAPRECGGVAAAV